LISIEVALFATLRKYRPGGGASSAFWLDVPDGTTIDQLLELLGIPATEAKQTFVNRHHQEGEYVLQDRERAAIFPPIAGG
jgi:molybdopterin converting factor small subunit